MQNFNFIKNFPQTGKRYADIMRGENSRVHEHREEDMANNDAGSEGLMTEDELMKAIAETIKRKEKQRAFWDQELKEMNFWLRL